MYLYTISASGVIYMMCYIITIIIFNGGLFKCFFGHVYTLRTCLLVKPHKLSFMFSDINECEGVNDCDINSDCINTYGSYNCTCHPGYSGNGRNCCEYTLNNIV